MSLNVIHVKSLNEDEDALPLVVVRMGEREGLILQRRGEKGEKRRHR
jgi:hypothetical protein